jgi:hypothetical protein
MSLRRIGLSWGNGVRRAGGERDGGREMFRRDAEERRYVYEMASWWGD